MVRQIQWAALTPAPLPPWAWLDTFPSFLQPAASLDGREEAETENNILQRNGAPSCTNEDSSEASREDCIPEYLSRRGLRRLAGGAGRAPQTRLFYS